MNGMDQFAVKSHDEGVFFYNTTPIPALSLELSHIASVVALHFFRRYPDLVSSTERVVVPRGNVMNRGRSVFEGHFLLLFGTHRATSVGIVASHGRDRCTSDG